MGLFDFFGGGLQKHAARVANKKLQALDRWASLQALTKMESAEAAEALLQRFTFRVDPSITDQEERDLAMRGILAAGAKAVEPVKTFLHKAESIAWPTKILERLTDGDTVVRELHDMLGELGVDYERDPQRKIDIIAYLEGHPHGNSAEALVRFLEDASETVRFHTVQSLLVQEDDVHELLLARLPREESVRVRVKIAEAAEARQWQVAEALASFLPDGFRVVDGKISRG